MATGIETISGIGDLDTDAGTANIDEFIEVRGYDAGWIINPDSIYIKDRTRINYNFFWSAPIQFQMLSGEDYECKTPNYHGASKIILFINDTNYLLEPPNDHGLFTFDAHLILSNNELIEYKFISYPYQSVSLVGLTLSPTFGLSYYTDSSGVNNKDDNGKYSIYHAFSLNSDLSDILETAGFATYFSRNQELFDSSVISNNIKSIEWKLRSRVNSTEFYAASSYRATQAISSPRFDDRSLYAGKVSSASDLGGMTDWIERVFPGWE
jgi:hypothetical protein